MSTITPSAATIEALKKKALEAAAKKFGEGSLNMDVTVDGAAKTPEPPTVWPSLSVNVANTEKYSVLFKSEWERLPTIQPDFDVPTFNGYEYPEAMKAHIPATSDYKADPQLCYDAVLAYAHGSVTHLVGWPGTGKSAGLPILIASRIGLPMLRLGLNKKGMQLDDLIGREAIKQGKEGTHTGHRDGLLIGWIEHPAIILADEFSRANAEITNGLMSLMERNGVLIVENRSPSIIRRHEHCWIIASDNVKGLGDGLDRMVGTDMLDNAVLDRFEITLEVDYLPAKDQEALIHQWFDKFPEKEASKIVKFGLLVQEGYKKGTLPVSFSPRSLKEVARYSILHQDTAIAVRKVMLNKVAEESDVAALKEMYRTAFGKTIS